jgi:hypothetical protein
MTMNAPLLVPSWESRCRTMTVSMKSRGAFVEASLREQNPEATMADIRKGLLLRFYGHEFDAPTRDKILVAIEQAASQRNEGS